MPIARFRLDIRQHSVNLGLFALLVLIATTTTAIYISHERNFHWWIDWHYKTLEVATAFKRSPVAGIDNVIQSLGDERNKIYTLPLVPFILLFGESRLVYEMSLALVYLLPFSLSLGAIATQLIQANPRAVFWSTTLLSLLIPVNWIPTFLGIPDTGGAALVALAAVVYLQDLRLKQWWRVGAIGLMLALAILLRRHFVYGAIAFLGAVGCQALIFFCFGMRSTDVTCHVCAWRNLRLVSLRLGLIAVICFTTLSTVAWKFTLQAMTTDYRHLYASWSFPFDTIVSLYASFYGWVTLLLVAIGFSAGILTRVLYLPAFSFIWLFGIFSLIEWLFILRYANVFYSLHITPIVVIGLTAFMWTTWLTLRSKVRMLMLVVVSCYLIGNLVVGLTFLGKCARPLRPLFAINIPPLVRTDYDEVARLVDYLRQLTPNKEPIYTVGFQRLQLNGSMLRAAERVLYREKNNKNLLLLLKASQVDSQDSYPVERLLQAQYVVIPNPLPDFNGDFTKVPVVGEWLPLKESDVVQVVFNAFRQNWLIARDFKRLPKQFHLAGGTTVSIYQRIRPTSLETAVQTLATMQQQIGDRPGGQLDWIGLSQNWKNYTLIKNPNKTYKIFTFERDRVNNQPVPFLYLGALPERAKIAGTINYFGTTCVGASLNLSMLDRSGDVIGVTENRSFSQKSSKFQLSVNSKNAAYLLLNILGNERNDRTNRCIVKIDSLKVSN